MADKLAGGIKAGSTSYSHSFRLLSLSDGSPVTGKVAADLTVTYRRPGATRQTVSLSNLAAIDSAWSSGGVKEDANGEYRLDLPDAMLATGVDWVSLQVVCTGAYGFSERIPLETKGGGEIYPLVVAIKAITDPIVVASGKVVAAITTAGDFVQAAADKVWASSSRVITGGPSVSLTTSVWAETPSTGAGTAGQLLTAAGTAADPLLNPVPGTYAAGTAGAALGSLGTEASDVAAIKAKTDQLTFSTPNVVDSSSTGGLTAAAIASAVLNTAMTESYAADGAQFTLTQGIYMLHQFLSERSVSGVTMTIKKLDGTTTAATITMNSATNPTAYTRTA